MSSAQKPRPAESAAAHAAPTSLAADRPSGQASAQLARRAEAHAVLYRFTDRLYRAGSIDEVYDAALEAITQGLGCERASVLLFDDGGVMRFMAWRGLSDAYRQSLEGHTPWRPGQVDPAPIWIADIEATAEPDRVKTAVLAEGIRSLGFIPLIGEGGVVGKFMAYRAQRHEVTADEADLALTIARQLGFAIEQRRAAEARGLADRRRVVLVNELNHRVKNTLATVQSLVSQTLRGAEAAPWMRDLLESRLAALATAHDVLTRSHWESADVEEIVRRAVEPFEGGGGRFKMAGPPARLPPRQALALSIALHELATNAAKYGALSSDDGRVEIGWRALRTDEAGELSLSWTEHGGPPVEPPTRKGFGSRLIERNVAFDLGGAAELDFRPEGVAATIRIRLRPPGMQPSETVG